MLPEPESFRLEPKTRRLEIIPFLVIFIVVSIYLFYKFKTNLLISILYQV